MNAIASLAMDVVVILLLATTIYYCIKLNRYIQAIRDSKSELAQVIQEFDKATARAQESIEDLKFATKQAAEHLQLKLDKAEFLADDLAFLIDKANKVTDKKGMPEPASAREKTPEAKKPQPRTAPPPPPIAKGSGVEKIAKRQSSTESHIINPSPGQKPDDKEPSKAELALMEALKSIR